MSGWEGEGREERRQPDHGGGTCMHEARGRTEGGTTHHRPLWEEDERDGHTGNEGERWAGFGRVASLEATGEGSCPNVVG